MHGLVGRVGSHSLLEDDFRRRRTRRRANPRTTHFTRKRRPRPFRTVFMGFGYHRHEMDHFYNPSTTFRNFDFLAVGAEVGVRARGGAEATSQKTCARHGISSQMGQRSGVCKNFHSNRCLGDGALTIRGPRGAAAQRFRAAAVSFMYARSRTTIPSAAELKASLSNPRASSSRASRASGCSG